jgi:hypothetical protein
MGKINAKEAANAKGKIAPILQTVRAADTHQRSARS